MTASNPQKSASKRITSTKTKSSSSVPTPIKTTKKSKSSNHPKFIDMITESLQKLNEKTGSSRQAILKFIVSNYSVDQKLANQYLKVALKNGVKSGILKQLKGVGASGSFKLAEKVVKSKRPARQVLKLKTENKTQNTKSDVKKTTKKKALTKEAAAAQIPSAPNKGRKQPTVREQIVAKKSRSTKTSHNKPEPSALSQTESQPETASAKADEKDKKTEPEKQVRVSARKAAESKSKKSTVATRGKKKQTNATETIQA